MDEQTVWIQQPRDRARGLKQIGADGNNPCAADQIQAALDSKVTLPVSMLKLFELNEDGSEPSFRPGRCQAR